MFDRDWGIVRHGTSFAIIIMERGGELAEGDQEGITPRLGESMWGEGVGDRGFMRVTRAR